VESVFNILTEVDERNHSYVANYALLENKHGFTKAKIGKTTAAKVPMKMLRNDGFLSATKIDSKTTAFRVYKELQFKGDYIQGFLKDLSDPLLISVLKEMTADWLTCGGF
jgi:hypothetical protein